MTTTYQDTLALVHAGARALHIASFEWERVRGWCIGFARDLGLTLWVWSSSSGLTELGEDGSMRTEDETMGEPIAAMQHLRDSTAGGVLLLEDVHPFLTESHHQVPRFVREMLRQKGDGRRLLVLSTPLPGLPIELQKEVPTVDLPLPGVDDLATVAREVAEANALHYETTPQLLEAARGLTVMEARLAFSLAAKRLGALGSGAISIVAREKERVIRQSQVLDYYEPDAKMNDVGGLETLKTWLGRRGLAFGAGARDFGLDSPKGVLLLGVQGCGKSLVAKAVASAWEFPLLRLDMGKVFGGIVGQSEANVRTALQVAQALAPCVLWIDEIEKGVAGMGSSDQTDGGTTARVVGTLLTWMQEKREPVFVVATANRIDMLPPELLRKGRFDELFFVDLPSASVRKDILRIHLEKKGRAPKDYDLDQLAALSVGLSGAEIEEAVREGLFEAFAERCELRTEHIATALRATFPLSRTMGEQIADLRRWAKVRARLASPEAPDEIPPQAATQTPKLRQETRNPFVPEAKT
jgi:AAA+ superfamily predicted ATPase